jgi:hypothetical protein
MQARKPGGWSSEFSNPTVLFYHQKQCFSLALVPQMRIPLKPFGLRITVYCKRISVLYLYHTFILYGFYGLYFIFVSVHTTVHTVLESGTWRLLNEL